MYEYKIKELLKVVDGDTIDVLIDLGFNITIKQRVRLVGIDAPESMSSDQTEKKFGLESKKYLVDWLADKKDLIVRTTKDDKYGRILAKVISHTSMICVNDDMIKFGYAWKYDGGTKNKNFDSLIIIRES